MMIRKNKMPTWRDLEYELVGAWWTAHPTKKYADYYKDADPDEAAFYLSEQEITGRWLKSFYEKTEDYEKAHYKHIIESADGIDPLCAFFNYFEDAIAKQLLFNRDAPKFGRIHVTYQVHRDIWPG